MNNLKEVNADIKDPKADVYAKGARDVEAPMTLGPSDGNMRIKLSSISTEGRASPPAVSAVRYEARNDGRKPERSCGARSAPER